MTTTPDSRTIVVGYDGSEPARHALARVARWATPATALVVVAVTPSVTSPGLGVEMADQHLEADAALREARDLLSADGSFAAVDTRAGTGDPAEVLIAIARELDADLLVVGRRGRDFVARALLGSVADRVVRHAPCDVLVVA